MSTKKFCDFCGNECYEEYTIGVGLFKINEPIKSKMNYHKEAVDVCGYCANKIRVFFEVLKTIDEEEK